ncbi:galactose-binding domain-like protein [Xylariales sp. PMI_506]|nr:galactose-binding domain-like protein [Xylariales sp. PMI_506]
MYLEEWHQHQRRDAFYRHASICEDYSAIQCPVFLVGGWMDSYHKSIFRMLEHLECPKKALVGPWAHLYPNFALPGPQIGFLQEATRWWDHCLKGEDSGIMKEPMVRAYLMDTVPPKTHYDFRPGRWVAEPSWPSPGSHGTTLGLAPGELTSGKASDAKLSICSPQTTGFASHRWLVFGKGYDAPSDQRIDAGGCLVFDSHTLEEPLDLLGAAVVQLRVAADKKDALVAAVLSEILADGSVTRLSYGLLNLTHRNNHTELEHLEPHKFYDVTVRMDECGQRLQAGSRLRLAVSSSFFPTVWPSPEPVTLTVDCAHSTIYLPVRHKSPLDDELEPFQPPVNGPALKVTMLRQAESSDTITHDLTSGRTTLVQDHDDGFFEIKDNGWRYGVQSKITASIKADDPSSASVEQQFRNEFGHENLQLVIEGVTRMTVTPTEMHMTAELNAFEEGKQVFGRENTFVIPRDHV